jgi:hypothetical protein
VAVKTATEVEALGLTFATEQQLFGQVGHRAAGNLCGGRAFSKCYAFQV